MQNQGVTRYKVQFHLTQPDVLLYFVILMLLYVVYNVREVDETEYNGISSIPGNDLGK